MELTEKEEIFMKRYQGFYKTYVLLFIFILICFSIQIYVFFSQVIPAYTKPFQHSPATQDFIKNGLFKTFEISFFWLALFIGCSIGDFLNYFKVRRIINKLKKNQ